MKHKLALLFPLVLSAFGPMFALQIQNVATTNPSGIPAGVILPESGTVFVLTATELQQLHTSAVLMNSHAGGSFVRTQSTLGAHASGEIAGTKAETTVQDSIPSFLIRVGSEDPELLAQRVHLIHLKPTKRRRTVLTFTQGVVGGQNTQWLDEVAVDKAELEQNAWLRLVPKESLKPGSYGIVILPADASRRPDAVYDFDEK